VIRTWSCPIGALLVLLLAACRPDQVTVSVHIPGEDGVETPVPGVRLVVLPYDRDSVLSMLEARAPTPRPSTAALDSLFQAFRLPFNEYLRLALASARLRAAADSAGGALAAALADSAAALTVEADRARETLAEWRDRIGPASDSLRRRIFAWEDTAFRSYDSATAAMVRSRRRKPITDSTGADGRVTVAVPSGAWWLTARAVNIQDPNAEWYWNVPVSGDTIRLNPTTGRARPRYRSWP
jgi:hypothetical protein